MKENVKREICRKLKSFFIVVVVLCSTACESTKAADVTVGTPQKAAPVKEKSPGVVFAEQLKGALQSGSIEDALKLFETIPDSLKDDTDMLILQASLLLSVGKIDEASAIADRLAVLDPNNVDVAELSLYIAKVNGNDVARKEQLQKILATDANNVEANIELAEEALDTNNYQQAQKYYQTALEGNADDADALFGLALSYYYLDKTDDAEKIFNRLLEKDSNNASALLYLGKISAEKEMYRAALKYVQRSVESDPSDYDALLDLGTYYRQLLDLKNAEVAWTKAIEIEPNFFLAYAYRASLYDELNETSKAYADYKKVVETNPKYFYAYESLGMFAWHEQDYTGSYKAFQKALSYSENNISYILMMAANLKKLGRDADFKAFLEQRMKKLDRSSLEYTMARLFHDGAGINAENSALLKIRREESSSKRGKFTFYMGLFYDMTGKPTLAENMYSSVLEMQHPMFFEYRLAEWSMQR